MKYTPWFVRGIVILLIIIVALTSCNKEENEAKITIGEVTRSVFYAPEYVAVAQGFLKSRDLRWTFKRLLVVTKRWRHYSQVRWISHW